MRAGERGEVEAGRVWGKRGRVVVAAEVTGGGHGEPALSMEQRDCC